MSKIIFIENNYKKHPSFRDKNIKGYYNFGVFKDVEYFEICTSSKGENDIDSHHYRQVIDIDKKTAVELIKLLKEKFKI